MGERNIHRTGHIDKLIKRGVGGNLASIKQNVMKMLKYGVKIKNPEKGKPAEKICIYKEKDKYFTIPFTELEKTVIIISVIPSKKRNRRV